MLGVVVVVVGDFLEVNFVHGDSVWFNADALLQRTCDVNFVIYVLVEIVVFFFILYLRYFVHYTDCLTSLLLVAIFGSFSVISTKAVSSMANLTLQGSIQLSHAMLYVMLFVMVISSLGQVHIFIIVGEA